MMGGGQFPLTTAEVIATMLRTSPAEQSSPVLTVRYPSCPQSNMPLRPSMVEFSMVSRSAWRPMWRVLSFSKKANSIHYQLRQCQSQSQSPRGISSGASGRARDCEHEGNLDWLLGCKLNTADGIIAAEDNRFRIVGHIVDGFIGNNL